MKTLYNPITDEVVDVAKAGYGGAGLPDRVMGFRTPAIGQARRVSALVPTGRHVGHANDLEVVRHGRRSTKGDTALERFHARGRRSGVHKGLVPKVSLAERLTGSGQTAAALRRTLTRGSKTPRFTAAMSQAKKAPVGKRDVSDLARQPGMFSPGVVTASWSHGSPFGDFATTSGQHGRRMV